MDQFIILHSSIDPSKRAELVSCQDSWEGGCQVTEKTQNLFGASNQRPSCGKIGKRLCRSTSMLCRCHQTWKQSVAQDEPMVHWRDGKQGCSRSMLALLIALIALNHFECCCTLLCKRSAAWGSEKCYGNSGKEGLEWRGCVSTFFDPFPTPVTSILPGIGWINHQFIPYHDHILGGTISMGFHGLAGTIWLHREEGESRLLQLFRRSDAWDATKQADQQWGKAAPRVSVVS